MLSRVFIILSVTLVCVLGFPWRIVGGHDAKIGEFPHQVSVRYGYWIWSDHVCGGSILNKRWILTAAHCITEQSSALLGTYIINAGTNDVNVNVQKISASRWIVHPDYKGGVNPNDIALIELSSDLEFNDKVKPISLPKPGQLFDGTSTLSGWGSMSRNNTPVFPAMLQTIDVPLYSYETCKWVLEGIKGSAKPLEDTNICTGSTSTPSASACSGDSGGPLIVRNGDKVIQAGVVSWGLKPCGIYGAPSVYTRVSAFIDFIEQYVKDHL